MESNHEPEGVERKGTNDDRNNDSIGSQDHGWDQVRRMANRTSENSSEGMMMTTTTTTIPRIYVASLADYNDGTLHGRWIDATMGVDHINEKVAAMLKTSPFARSEFARQWGMTAEEWAIHDYQGFGSWRMSEWESFETVTMVAEMIEEHGEGPIGAYIADRGDVEDLEEGFEESWQGQWESTEDYVREFYESTGIMAEIPEWVRMYIDFNAIARDSIAIGSISAIDDGEGGVYIFTN